MFNRLYLNRVYLAGQMDRIPDGGVQWRKDLTPWLNSRGIVVLDPTAKPVDIGLETAETRKIRQEGKHHGDFTALLEDKEVRSTDLRMVDISDFLIVKIDISTHASGTYEELYWANREKKPVLVMCEQGKNNVPDWLFWTIPHEHMFGSWDDLKLYIDHVAFAKEVDRKKRWIFFNLEEVTQAAINGFSDLRNGV